MTEGEKKEKAEIGKEMGKYEIKWETEIRFSAMGKRRRADFADITTPACFIKLHPRYI